MSNMTMRMATVVDAQAISALIERTIRTTNAPDYEAEVIELICANFTSEKVARSMATRDVFVCFVDDTLAGTISLGGDKLHSLFVEPKLQRRGIGARLVDHLERHAIGKGLWVLRLSSSITARAFYERLGYQLIKFEERPDGSTFLMRKVLAPF
jgi:putative acetyltransferase